MPAVVLGLERSVSPGHPSALGGWIGWPVLLGVAYQALWRIDREKVERFASILPPAHIGCLLLATGLASWELSWQIDRVADGVWPGLAWGVVPTAPLWILGSARPWPEWPVARHAASYREVADGCSPGSWRCGC